LTGLPKGFRFAGVAAGIKKKVGARDLSLVVSDAACVAAGVYTQNAVVAAPVLLCREITPTENARAVVINSGNANACTGSEGAENARQMALSVSEELGRMTTAETAGNEYRNQDLGDVFVLSTGVIGKKLPMEKVLDGIHAAASSLDASKEAFLNCVDGICTTDAFRKYIVKELSLAGQMHSVSAMAKGAGMIGPKMATMLSVICVDVPLTAKDAQAVLMRVSSKSFNCVSVEGHTSTNDSVVLLSSNPENQPAISGESLIEFESQLTDICIELAKMLAADGEGATHTIEIRIAGATNNGQADKIARCVASSNLVKTAVTGNDPNWGRIVSAAGYADADVNPDRLTLRLNGVLLFENGEPANFEASALSQSMAESKEVLVELTVGDGSGEAVHWTSDLTTSYVEFNAVYTT
jgi:glutamate N-acetyltransferase/amino-acid N-acetyltransferase